MVLSSPDWWRPCSVVGFLYDNGTAACGTAKKNRVKLPASFKNARLKKGEHQFRRNDMLAIFLNDKKEMYFLSTLHKVSVIDTRKRDRRGSVMRKLKLVDDYNKFIGGVRKSMKWTKKVVFHFIQEGTLARFPNVLLRFSDIDVSISGNRLSTSVY